MDLTHLINYWIVQNTGWSGGVSWFDVGGSPAHPARFPNQAGAAAYAQKVWWADAAVRWRLVNVRIETSAQQRVTTETFHALQLENPGS